MSCGGGHLGFPIGIKNRKFVEDLPMIIPGYKKTTDVGDDVDQSHTGEKLNF